MNTTLTNCANTTLSLSEGSYSLTVYANDTAGNIGSDSFSFSVVKPPISNLQYPFNLLAGIGIAVGYIFFLITMIASELTPNKLIALMIASLIMVAMLGILL